jgi:hypothetical protein
VSMLKRGGWGNQKKGFDIEEIYGYFGNFEK